MMLSTCLSEIWLFIRSSVACFFPNAVVTNISSSWETIPVTKTTPPERREKSFPIIYPLYEQEVKVIWQKAPHGGPIPRLGVTPGGRKLYLLG